MSDLYLQLDLEVFERAANVARAGGITFEQAFAGLGWMWKHCWTSKTDVVATAHVSGFFGSQERSVIDALEAFGFLERIAAEDTERPTWRVKGARDRILRVKRGVSAAARAARSKGGKAAAKNLKQNQAAPVQPDMLGGDDAPAGAPPRAMSVHQQRWAEMQERRAAHLEALGIDAPPEVHAPARINTSLAKLAKALSLRDEMTFDGSEIPELWARYLEWDAPAGDSPPWPLNKFLSPGVIDNCVRGYVKDVDESIAAPDSAAEGASA